MKKILILLMSLAASFSYAQQWRPDPRETCDSYRKSYKCEKGECDAAYAILEKSYQVCIASVGDAVKQEKEEIEPKNNLNFYVASKKLLTKALTSNEADYTQIKKEYIQLQKKADSFYNREYKELLDGRDEVRIHSIKLDKALQEKYKNTQSIELTVLPAITQRSIVRNEFFEVDEKLAGQTEKNLKSLKTITASLKNFNEIRLAAIRFQKLGKFARTEHFTFTPNECQYLNIMSLPSGNSEDSQNFFYKCGENKEYGLENIPRIKNYQEIPFSEAEQEIKPKCINELKGLVDSEGNSSDEIVKDFFNLCLSKEFDNYKINKRGIQYASQLQLMSQEKLLDVFLDLKKKALNGETDFFVARFEAMRLIHNFRGGYIIKLLDKMDKNPVKDEKLQNLYNEKNFLKEEVFRQYMLVTKMLESERSLRLYKKAIPITDKFIKDTLSSSKISDNTVLPLYGCKYIEFSQSPETRKELEEKTNYKCKL